MSRARMRGTESSQTRRWRKADLNSWSRFENTPSKTRLYLACAATSTKIPNYRYVVAEYAMYARYGKQREDIAGGSDGCCAPRHYAFD